MAVYRCLIALSFLSDPEDSGLNRSFKVGDEVTTERPIDELYESRRGPHFVKISDDNPEEESDDPDLNAMSVGELRELAAEMGFDDLPKGIKKAELVQFLTKAAE